MAEKLTKAEADVLHALTLRPSGAMFREVTLKDAVSTLAAKGLVCDWHDMGSAWFTRITDAGRAALQSSEARPIGAAATRGRKETLDEQ